MKNCLAVRLRPITGMQSKLNQTASNPQKDQKRQVSVLVATVLSLIRSLAGHPDSRPVPIWYKKIDSCFE